MSSCARATSLVSALVLTAVVAGCSDLYTDRRNSIMLSSGDAIAANRMTQMVDPWPRVAADRNIAFNGQRMQSAVERYRENKVTAPVSAMTSSAQYQQAQPVVIAPTSGAGKP